MVDDFFVGLSFDERAFLVSKYFSLGLGVDEVSCRLVAVDRVVFSPC